MNEAPLPSDLRSLLGEAQSYVQSFAMLTKHPTAPRDAMDLYDRIEAALKPAVQTEVCPVCRTVHDRPLCPTPETDDDLTDKQRLDFLEAWVKHSRDRGFKWDSFTFDTDPTKSVREQIDQQIVVGMVEILKAGSAEKTSASHPEDICERCHGPNTARFATSWFAPNDLWNKVVGSPNGILCPVCFIAMAQAAGINGPWRVAPDVKADPLAHMRWICIHCNTVSGNDDQNCLGCGKPRYPLRDASPRGENP